MNRSRVKRLGRNFYFLYFHHRPSFYVVRSCILLGPAAEREWAVKKLVAVWPPQTSRMQRPYAIDLSNAANITECVFQTPIRAGHRGRYIRLKYGAGSHSLRRDVPIHRDSTLRDDRDARRFAASVNPSMPPYPFEYNVLVPAPH